MKKQFQNNLNRYDLIQEIEYCSDVISDIERVISILDIKKKVQITLKLEKVHLYSKFLKSIKLSPGQTTSNEETNKINQFLLEIYNLENNQYNLNDSMHFHFYDFLFKFSEFNKYFKKDFLISYTGFVNLVVDNHHAIISQKDELINHFRCFLERLNELNLAILETKKEPLQNVDYFYNFVKEFGVEDKNNLIEYNLFIDFYFGFIQKNANQLELVYNSLIILYNDLNNTDNIDENYLIGFVMNSLKSIYECAEILEEKKSKNFLKEKASLVKLVRYKRIIKLYVEKIFHIQLLDINLSNEEYKYYENNFGDFIFIFRNKDYKYENLEKDLLLIKVVYYFLDLFNRNINSNILNLILKNNNGIDLKSFFEKSVVCCQEQVKDLRNILNSDYEVKKIVEEFYKELMSDGYKILEFTFEVSKRERVNPKEETYRPDENSLPNSLPDIESKPKSKKSFHLGNLIGKGWFWGSYDDETPVEVEIQSVSKGVVSKTTQVSSETNIEKKFKGLKFQLGQLRLTGDETYKNSFNKKLGEIFNELNEVEKLNQNGN